MERYTEEDRKMIEFAAYCIKTHGVTSGCACFNTCCSDYTVAKKKTLDELEAEADAML